MASEIAAEPPTAAGHPKVCAAVPSAAPTADDARVWNARKACAARPPNKARPSGVRNSRAVTETGIPATALKRASFTGWSGTWIIGRSKSSVTSAKLRESGPKTDRQTAASFPSAPAVWLTSR